MSEMYSISIATSYVSEVFLVLLMCICLQKFCSSPGYPSPKCDTIARGKGEGRDGRGRKTDRFVEVKGRKLAMVAVDWNFCRQRYIWFVLTWGKWKNQGKNWSWNDTIHSPLTRLRRPRAMTSVSNFMLSNKHWLVLLKMDLVIGPLLAEQTWGKLLVSHWYSWQN